MAPKRGSASTSTSDDTGFADDSGFDVSDVFADEDAFGEGGGGRGERVRSPEELEALMRRDEARARIALASGNTFYGYVVGRNQDDWEEIAAFFDRPGQAGVTTDDIRDCINAAFDGHDLLCRLLNRDPATTTIGDAQEQMLERLTGQRGDEGWAALRGHT